MMGAYPHVTITQIDAVSPYRRALVFVKPFSLWSLALTTPTAPITLYTSAVCAYCMAAKQFLRSRELEWTEVRIDQNPAARMWMVETTGRTSVPQIFIGDTHIGGYDDMMALHRAGKFDPLLTGAAK